MSTVKPTPCTCDLSHEICSGGAECGKNNPDQEIIKANAEKGYIYLGSGEQFSLYKKHEHGIDVYYLDEGYDCGALTIWNSLRGPGILKLILKDMEQNKIPLGIVAGINDKGTVFYYKGTSDNYESWYRQYFNTEYLIPYKICVDGTEWSVGEECFMGYEEFIIRRLEWSENKFSEGGGFWCAYREGDTIGHGVKMWLRKLPSPTTGIPPLTQKEMAEKYAVEQLEKYPTGKDSGEGREISEYEADIRKKYPEWKDAKAKLATEKRELTLPVAKEMIAEYRYEIKQLKERLTQSKPQVGGLTMEAVLDKNCDSLPAWTHNRKEKVLAAMKEWGEYCAGQALKVYRNAANDSANKTRNIKNGRP